MGRSTIKREDAPTSNQDREVLDKAEGWSIIRRFKNKAGLAVFANNPAELADLEYRYPLITYRRKLDLDRCYLAILQR